MKTTEVPAALEYSCGVNIGNCRITSTPTLNALKTTRLWPSPNQPRSHWPPAWKSNFSSPSGSLKHCHSRWSSPARRAKPPLKNPQFNRPRNRTHHRNTFPCRRTSPHGVGKQSACILSKRSHLEKVIKALSLFHQGKRVTLKHCQRGRFKHRSTISRPIIIDTEETSANLPKPIEP